MQTNENKEYQEFKLKTSIILDASVLTFIMIMFSIFGLGIPFGIVFASVIGTMKSRLNGGKERTFSAFMEFSMHHIGKATLIWLMLYPILLIIGSSFIVAKDMGDIGLYIIIIDILAIVTFFAYCFYVFYEFASNPETKKIKIFKIAYTKMIMNISNTFLHLGLLVGVAGVIIFIPYTIIKIGLTYLLIVVLMIISNVSMRDAK